MKKIALVFPGQGSQALGMLSELAASYPIIQEVFNDASSILGYDLWQLSQQGPEEKLNQTEYAQPELLAGGFALWKIWQKEGGLAPSFLAGHSLGEYTALVCAEVLSFADAINLVAERGRIMQKAVPIGKGAMAAIVGLEEMEVRKICEEAREEGEALEIANYNSPLQIVVAGEMAAVKRTIAMAEAKKAKLAKLLAMSVPSHCSLMKGAAKLLQEKLEKIKFNMPKIPVINNVDVAVYNDSAKIKDALVRQLYSSVRWVEIIRTMQDNGVEGIFECGPGKVLTGLNKRIVKNVAVDILGVSFNLQNALNLIRGN